MQNLEIAIIGAGPAGLASALELRELGHKDIIVFDREDEAGGTPRHCGHLGFGIFEFYKIMSGPKYSQKLVGMVEDENIKINLKHTLIKIKDDILIFSTPNGIKEYKAQRTILAMGARETPRAARLTSGTRSPNIITTGALQRLTYMQKLTPFKNPVIIGSEVVSFSALMTARHAGMKVSAIIEEDSHINSFCILKPLTQLFLQTPVKIGYKILSINGEDKQIHSITIQKGNEIETILCDGVIFSGKFTPESAIVQKSFEKFNYNNNSIHISQIYQTQNKNFFAAGNVIRGALTAFKCYFEGKKVASFVDKSLRNKQNNPIQIPIIVDENIQWYYPSMVDITRNKEILTTLRMDKKTKGELTVTLNDKKVLVQKINDNTYNNIEVPWINMRLKSDDKIYINYKEN